MGTDLPERPPVPTVPRRRWARLVRWAPFAVPVLYVLFVLAVQPAEQLGPPAWAHDTWQILYDDFDFTAVALRGLNATLGRTPGRPDAPPWTFEPDEFLRTLDSDPPLEPHYYLEYPHAALYIFRLGCVLQPAPPPMPPAVLDCAYHNLVILEPRNDAERSWCGWFRRATQIYLGLMTLCLLALVVVLRRGYEPGGGLASTGILLVLPGFLYFALFRFDIIPTLLTALSLACLGRRRVAASAALLAAATMVKVYPVLLAPLVVRYLWPRRREAVVWVVAYGLTAAAILVPPLLADGPGAVLAPYRLQLTREKEPRTLYGVLLPEALADNDLGGRAFRFGALALTLAALCWRRPADLAGLLRRGAVVLIVFLTLPVFYSPQWILWLAPLLLPLVPRHRGLGTLTFFLVMITWGTFPFSPPSEGFDKVMLAIRELILVALAVCLLRAEWRANSAARDATSEPPPAQAGQSVVYSAPALKYAGTLPTPPDRIP